MLTIIKNHHSIKFVTFCDFNGEFKGYTRDVDMTLYAMNLDQSDNSIKYEEITNSQPESGSIQFSTPFDSVCELSFSLTQSKLLGNILQASRK